MRKSGEGCAHMSFPIHGYVHAHVVVSARACIGARTLANVGNCASASRNVYVSL